MSDNIHIKYCDSGIIKVIVNTETRWCSYDCYENCNEGFTVREYPDSGVDKIFHEFTIDFKPNTRYIRITDQEKEQIYVYFIPTDMI